MEPTLESIDDYNNNESPQKRATIYKVIYGLLALAVVLGGLKLAFYDVSDYSGTPQNPGIVPSKG